MNNNDIVNFVRKTDHQLNLLAFGAIVGFLPGLICYYFFNKTWARIVFGTLLVFSLIGIFKIITSGKILTLLISSVAGAVISLIIGVLIGIPKWKKTEEI